MVKISNLKDLVTLMAQDQDVSMRELKFSCLVDGNGAVQTITFSIRGTPPKARAVLLAYSEFDTTKWLVYIYNRETKSFKLQKNSDKESFLVMPDKQLDYFVIDGIDEIVKAIHGEISIDKLMREQK